MEWMGWLVAALVAGMAAWLFVQLRNERTATRRLDDELAQALADLDASRDIQARLVPNSETSLLGRLAGSVAADLQAPLAAAATDVRAAGGGLDEYRGLVKAYDNAVQYCLQPVEMIFGADKAGLDQLVRHVEEARRKLFAARAALEKSPLLSDAKSRLEGASSVLAGSSVLATALQQAARAPQDPLEATDLGSALDAALAIVASDWNGRIEIVRDYADLPKVKVPADQLTRIFVNLAVNAGEAVDGTGRLVVQARPSGARGIEISFIDDGRGIDDMALPNIFEPFFSTRNAAAGLGLANVRGIVKAHGGSVNVRTTPGEGSTFTVTLPAEPVPPAGVR